MIIKRRLTEVAVDSLTEYLQERFAKIKELDLDKDGQRDVDQVVEIVGRCGERAKEALSKTNVASIAAGLELIMNGVSLIKNSIDQETLAALYSELSTTSTKLTHLGQLSIQHVKETGGRE